MLIKLTMLFILILSGCGRQAPSSEMFSIPQNTANALQSDRINEVVTQIEADLKELGVDKNLKQIPIIVFEMDEETKVGVCVKKKTGEGLYIGISPKVLNQDKMKGYLPAYFHTILHEIGHCYFNRVHEEVMPDPLHGKGHVFTVMNTKVWFLIPESLRKYYVGEIAGIGRVYNDEDLERISESK